MELFLPTFEFSYPLTLGSVYFPDKLAHCFWKETLLFGFVSILFSVLSSNKLSQFTTIGWSFSGRYPKMFQHKTKTICMTQYHWASVYIFLWFCWTDLLSCSQSEDFVYAFASAQVYLKPWLLCPSHHKIGPWTIYCHFLVYLSLFFSLTYIHTHIYKHAYI